jgi:N utilization substance protein B
MTGYRRKARELALQVLYYLDINHIGPDDNALHEALTLFYSHFPPSGQFKAFFETLVKGVLENRKEIDTLIEKHSKNWKISRMSCVDRNILRLAAFELLYCADIPVKVTINEAIDVGKKYGTKESGAFVNGIIDGIRKVCDRQSQS